MTPLEARLLLKNLVKDREIIRHSLIMESIMAELAERLHENIDTWAVAGLLHDLDYPQTRVNPSKHGVIAAEILRGEGADEDIIRAVLSHTGSQPVDTKLKIALYVTETFLEMIRDNQYSMEDIKGGAYLNDVRSEKLSLCEKLGFTINEFVDIILRILKNEKFSGCKDDRDR